MKLPGALIEGLLLLSALSCAPPKGTVQPQRDTPSAMPSSNVNAQYVFPAPSAVVSAPFTAVPVTELVLPTGALFAYREGDVSLTFTPPRRVTLLGSTESPCSYELGDNGNMYSGAEIEAAWRNVEVASAVAQLRSFIATDELPLGGEARGVEGRIVWTPFCGGLCVEGPRGVAALSRVLRVLVPRHRGIDRLRRSLTPLDTPKALRASS